MNNSRLSGITEEQYQVIANAAFSVNIENLNGTFFLFNVTASNILVKGSFFNILETSSSICTLDCSPKIVFKTFTVS